MITSENLQQRDVAFKPGDTVRVHYRVIEGSRERVQVFEGLCISRKGGGINETFTVRKNSFGVNVERIFPLQSPKIAKIEVATRGAVRRAKLYYIRDKVGKKARVKTAKLAHELPGAPQAGESPLYAFDAVWVLQRGGPLAGADEAGRGALAGPLVAAAVILGGREISYINDSKALRPGLREKVFGSLLCHAEAVSVVAFPAWWIDRHGVGRANREALTGALSSLDAGAGCRLADGNLALGPEVECLPRADATSAAVAAASVVAKVVRDDAMRALSEQHSGYGFERNRGYGTAEHRGALVELGPCRVHRLSYAGVGD